MEIYAISVMGIKKDVSKVFKIEVTETDKSYRIESTPYQLGRVFLRKTEEYKPLGIDEDIMYGTNKDKLLREWSDLAELEENREMGRHVKAMADIKAKLYITEDFQNE